MNAGLWKKIGIFCASIVGVVYIGFLFLPFIVSPLVNNYLPQLNEEVKKSTGLELKTGKFGLVTTPKFTVGIRLRNVDLSSPDGDKILSANDLQIKMSLLSLLKKRIKVDVVRLKDIQAVLQVNKDGSFAIEKYFPKTEENTKTETQKIEIPFGLRLSNKLPDIRVEKYMLTFTDASNGDEYVISGNKLNVTDFILNKEVKVALDGNVKLKNREQFKYDLKVYNKIMPDLDLHELVFNPQPKEEQNKQDIKVNIIDIFKSLYSYNITANATSDITTSVNSNNGFVIIDNFSVSPNGIKIPPSNAKVIFKGEKININADLYTANNEISTLAGEIKSGKNTKIDMNVKSKAQLANILRIVNAFAVTFNIKDLQTVSATGSIDADFNVKSDMKSVKSSGYFKIPSASIKYGLYNISIDKIIADILFNDNNINIKNVGFSIFNQPLQLNGTIKDDATVDLHLLANNLNLKGLLVALGQASLLKDNQVNSGLVSLKVEAKGKPDKIKPKAEVMLSNLDMKNVPADLRLIIPNTKIEVITDGKDISGVATGLNIKAVNPAITVSVPKLSANISEDVIEINPSAISADKINFSLSGKIKNYMTEKMILDFVTTGDISSTLSGNMNMAKQNINITFNANKGSTIVIPGFNKSKMSFDGNILMSGSMTNPNCSGVINTPSINIPEIPVVIENAVIKINGKILNGNATVSKLTNNGIVAENISTDFSLKNTFIYLNNLKGNAFDGTFAGNIVYNLANAETKLSFKGENMNAEKAVAGAAGIKNALTGKLNFDTNMKISVLPDFNSMMKSLSGNLNFKISNGAFGKIGRLENFLQANNLVSNALLKTTVQSFSNLAPVRNSAQFDYIDGTLTFSNGNANLTSIKSTGKSLAYYITGSYNLISGYTNVNILGRMDGAIVKLLGPVGELSASKILSYIPKFGTKTADIVNILTSNPKTEKTENIPALTDSTKAYKDFKVVFNGNVTSPSSVKSFKWLSNPDLSAIQPQSIQETIKSLKTNVDTDVKTTVTNVKDMVDTVKQQKELLKNSANDIKNLFKF